MTRRRLEVDEQSRVRNESRDLRAGANCVSLIISISYLVTDCGSWLNPARI